MRFWDSSALVPLLLEQPRSELVRRWLREDGDLVVWWGSEVECASAIARMRREDRLSSSDERTALAMLDELAASWFEVQPAPPVRDQARRVLRLHPLRAADALQLAAALEWSGPGARGAFLGFDERLQVAAEREGFRVP